MLPPPCHGGVCSRMSALPKTTPMPVGAKILCPEKTKKSQSYCCTSTRVCATDCAPSNTTLAPYRCAIAIISCAGVIVPSAFDTWENETSFVRGPSRRSYSSRSTWPGSSTGATRSFAPFSAQSICHGTMLAWCSSQVMTISSSFRMLRRPQLCAIRLIPSVVPRTKTISLVEPRSGTGGPSRAPPRRRRSRGPRAVRGAMDVRVLVRVEDTRGDR